MNREMSQGQATRSIFGRSRVTHFIGAAPLCKTTYWGSLALWAHHRQARNLQVAALVLLSFISFRLFPLLALLLRCFFLPLLFSDRGALHRHRMADMVSKRHGLARDLVLLTGLVSEYEFVLLISLLQASSHLDWLRIELRGVTSKARSRSLFRKGQTQHHQASQ